MEKPEDLPRLQAEKIQALAEKERVLFLRDYLAGMTDRFAELASELLPD